MRFFRMLAVDQTAPHLGSWYVFNASTSYLANFLLSTLTEKI